MRQEINLNSFVHPRPPVDDNRKLTAAEWARYLGFRSEEEFRRAVEYDER